jgi:two-component system cell cycle response regulator CtrA
VNPLTVAPEMLNAVGIPSTASNHQSTIRTGDLAVDLETGVVTADGKRVWLTEKEYCIFELLSLRQSITVSKEILHRHLYGEKDGPRSRIIDVFVCHLRKKLTQATGGKHHIETVWGRGYRMRDPGQ